MDRHLAIQCFCRVVESGSFAAAARDLDCSRSVVTKYVQHLEDWTGSRLLARTTRAMQLTEAGERFYAYCQRVVADTEATLSVLRETAGAASGRLVVAAPVSMTLGLLADHLHAFQSAHPQIELEVRLSDRATDLVREGVDVALRGIGRLEDSSLVAAPLLQFERVLCAAPTHWQAHGKPATPDELDPAHCLPYLFGSDATLWRFYGPGGEYSVEVAGSFRTDNSLLLIDALRRGRGVGLVPRLLIERDLREGRMETALEGFRTEPRTLHAVYPSRSHLAGKVRAFVRFMKARLAAKR